MPNPDTTNFTFYKAYCFSSLSPTFNQWARLTAADVHALGALLEYEGREPIPLPILSFVLSSE